MTLIEQVRKQMMDALKAHDAPRKEALSALLAALKSKAIDKRSDLTNEEEIAVIMREIKQLKETIETAPVGYEEIVEKSKATIEILSEYLPQQMSETEIKQAIDRVLKTLEIEKPEAKDKGIIMKNLMPVTKGKADGAMVNTILSSYFQ